MARLGMIAVLVLVLAPAARGEYVGFAFTAVDANGRVATGGFSWNAAAPGVPFMTNNPNHTEFRPSIGNQINFYIAFDGMEFFYLTPGSAAFSDMIVVINNPPGVASDLLVFQDTRDPRFSLGFSDGDGLDTAIFLPRTLDLSRFGSAGVGYWTPGGPNFSGRITSLTPGPVVVPEPSSVMTLGVGALGVVGLVWRRGRKAA